MSLRNKPTIQAGIIRDVTLGNIRVVQYEPGNSTRYEVLVSDFRGIAFGGSGPEGGWVVAYGDRSMVIPQGVFLHWTWVGKQLKIVSVSDCVVLAELLGHLLDLSAISCEEYQLDNP